jgi:hypothetical protein
LETLCNVFRVFEVREKAVEVGPGKADGGSNRREELASVVG